MEKIDEQNKEYINKLDNEESEIYIYDSIIESCDKNLFYLSGELFQIFCENKSKCSIITDVKDIFELVTEVFYPLFEKNKEMLSCSVPTLDQLVLAELLNNGSFERNLNRIRRKIRKNEI